MVCATLKNVLLWVHMKEPKDKSFRAIAYMDPSEYRQLKAKLALIGMTFSKWVREEAHKLIKN